MSSTSPRDVLPSTRPTTSCRPPSLHSNRATHTRRWLEATTELRRACAAKLARENGLEADPETEILVTMGAKQGLALAVLSTLESGDEVLVEDPGFVSYQPAI